MATHPAIGGSEEERYSSALMVRVAEGDEKALAELYDETSRLVYGLALRILGTTPLAEEVTMEVYLQVWRTARTYDGRRGRVSSWLIALTRSRAIDVLRSRRGKLEQPLDSTYDLADARIGPEGHFIHTRRTRIIQKFLAELPESQRNVIEMAYFSELSHSEVAAHTGLPLGTIKSRIRMGLLRLRELMAPYAEDL